MPRFPHTIQADPPLLSDVFRAHPQAVRHILELNDAVLRRPDSPLSVQEKEFIAAFVSATNACKFCTGIHSMIAELHGISPQVFESLFQTDLCKSKVHIDGLDDKWIPLLRYVQKLTQTPHKMTDKDSDAVYAAGWTEAQLYEAILVCALFNFMNRIVDGTGVLPTTEGVAQSRARHAASMGSLTPYMDFGIKTATFCRPNHPPLRSASRVSHSPLGLRLESQLPSWRHSCGRGNGFLVMMEDELTRWCAFHFGTFHHFSPLLPRSDVLVLLLPRLTTRHEQTCCGILTKKPTSKRRSHLRSSTQRRS